MVRIGIAGIGFMGTTHYKAIARLKGARVTAICTRDPKKLGGDWRSVKGNFGDDGGVHDLLRVAAYERLEDLLADDGVDLVDICLPTTMHCEWTLAALAAGRHVFLEKPIALDLRQADRMVAEAKKRGLRLMVAHVLRFFPEFRLIRQLMDGGEHGRVLAADFKRVISMPSWWDPKDLDRTGGPAIDLHIHDADFVRFLFGMPGAVTSAGVIRKGGVVEHIDTHYHFEGGPQVTARGGWLSQPGCPFEHGYDVFFEGAALKYNSSSGQPPVLLTADGRTRRPRLSRKDGFAGELGEAVRAVAAGRDSEELSGVSARDSLRLCLKEIESVRRGRRVRV